MKILVNAYACSPYEGSEAGVAWGFICELSKHHHLWVIVEKEKYEAHIQKFFKANLGALENLNFIFIPKKRRRILRKIWPPSYYWYYKKWHRDAYEVAKELHALHNFDLAHQLTMVGFREPGFLWELDIPFVWGPIGGMGYFPLNFYKYLDLYSILYYVAYNLFNAVHMHYLPRPKQAAIKANAHNNIGLIAATVETQICIKKYWGQDSIVIAEIGPPYDDQNLISLKTPQPNEIFRIGWAGDLIPRKALNLAMLSLIKVPAHINWHLEILGDGFMKNKLVRLSAKLGIDSRTTFHGRVSRDQVHRVLNNCDILLITSLRDLTSTVTLEALSIGLPVICLDHLGISDAVTAQCGIKVSIEKSDNCIHDIASAVRYLAEHPAHTNLMSIAAKQRSEFFSWENKIVEINKIYNNKIDRNTPNEYFIDT